MSIFFLVQSLYSTACSSANFTQLQVRDERAKAIETFLTQQQFEAKLGAGKKNSKGRKRK